MIRIVQKGDLVLRAHAEAVKPEEVSSKRIQDVITRMTQGLEQEEDGVAIAAPQIGEPLRIFIVSGKVFMASYPDIKPEETIPPHLVFINPEIIKLSKRKKKMPEGCLSVRWLYGNVSRSTQATIRALDEHGNTFTRGGSGILAQIFQHETDHLNGVLFIDSAENIEDIPPEKTNDKS